MAEKYQRRKNKKNLGSRSLRSRRPNVSTSSQISQAGNKEEGPIVFLTCFLPLGPFLIRTLERFAAEIRSQGASLVVGTAGNVQQCGSDLRLLSIPSSLSEYSVDGAQCQSDRHAIDSYDQWLAEVDSAWMNRPTDFDRALAGISVCRQVARDTLLTLRPIVALLWSSGVFPVSRIWHETATRLGIPTFCIERGFLPDTWMVDAGGMQAQSDLCTHPAVSDLLQRHVLTNLVDRYRDWFGANRLRKYGVSGDGAESLRGRLGLSGSVVVCLGGADCAGLVPRSIPGAVLNSPGYADSRAMLEALDRAAAEFPEVSFVFKPHPFDGHLYPDALFGRVRVVINADPVDLIELSDVVVCGITSLQFTAVLLRRSVVLTARSALHGRGVAYEALWPAELSAAIGAALNRENLSQKQIEGDRLLDGLLTHSFYALSPAVPARDLADLARICTVGGGSGEADFALAKLKLNDAGIEQFYGRGLHGVQCFWPVDGGYSEESSQRDRWSADGEIHSVQFDFPFLVEGSLRIDPADGPCRLLLESMEVMRGDDWISLPLTGITASPGNDAVQVELDGIDVWISLGDDPIWLIPITEGPVRAARITGKKFPPPLAGLVQRAVMKGRVATSFACQYLTREVQALSAHLSISEDFRHVNRPEGRDIAGSGGSARTPEQNETDIALATLQSREIYRLENHIAHLNAAADQSSRALSAEAEESRREHGRSILRLEKVHEAARATSQQILAERETRITELCAASEQSKLEYQARILQLESGCDETRLALHRALAEREFHMAHLNAAAEQSSRALSAEAEESRREHERSILRLEKVHEAARATSQQILAERETRITELCAASEQSKLEYQARILQLENGCDETRLALHRALAEREFHMAKLNAAFDESRREHENVITRLERSHESERAALQQIISEQGARISEINSATERSLSEYEKELNHLAGEHEAKLKTLERDLLGLVAQRQALEERLRSLLGSWSWRISAPMRWMRDRLNLFDR
jgi:hypothetical protein